MSRRSRRNHSPSYSRRRWPWLRSRVKKTLAELAQLHDVHTTQIAAWKSQLLEGAADVFGSGSAEASPGIGVDLKTLHAKIGELTLENDFCPLRSARRDC